MTAARLTEVVVRSHRLDTDAAVFAAITGTAPEPLRDASSGDDAVFIINDARLTLSASSGAEGTVERGIERLVIDVADLDAATRRLLAEGAPAGKHRERTEIDRSWAGLFVELREMAPAVEQARPVGAVLDHVAILVADLEAMARHWAAILGTPPAEQGLHPLGTAMAARFLLGDRMIELLAPLAGRRSTLQERHDRVGDGPLALAIIASDLGATIAAVEAVGARVVDQPPHRVVHPSDASGVPIQLTPRVNH